MDWKTLANDIVLFNELVERFVEIGCTEKKAFELATYVYAYNLLLLEHLQFPRKMINRILDITQINKL